MNSWHVYEHLKRFKGHIPVSELEEEFRGIPFQELCEGIHEWLLLRKTESELICEQPFYKKRGLPPSY